MRAFLDNILLALVSPRGRRRICWELLHDKMERRLPKHFYSMLGEDRIARCFLGSYFGMAGKPGGGKYILSEAGGLHSPVSYLDIGCQHAINDNNTYLFYNDNVNLGRKDWVGVLIDPNPHTAASVRKYRPDDVFIQAGVGCDGNSKAIYYDFGKERSHMNTFSLRQKGHYADSKWKFREIEMPLVHINDVLEKYFCRMSLNFLSIDAEGLEFRILDAMDFRRFRPKVICVESSLEDIRLERFVQRNNGYKVIAYTGLNVLLADKSQYSKDIILRHFSS